jgi:hypothetical protein
MAFYNREGVIMKDVKMNSKELDKISEQILKAAHFKLVDKITLSYIQEFKRRLITKVKVIEKEYNNE